MYIMYCRWRNIWLLKLICQRSHSKEHILAIVRSYLSLIARCVRVLCIRVFTTSTCESLREQGFTFTVITMASNYSDSVVHHTRQELTSDDKKYAAVHLNETDKIRKNAVAEIKRWIEECDDLRIQINKNDRGNDYALKYIAWVFELRMINFE